jgi:hypothetical protein
MVEHMRKGAFPVACSVRGVCRGQTSLLLVLFCAVLCRAVFCCVALSLAASCRGLDSTQERAVVNAFAKSAGMQPVETDEVEVDQVS